MSVYCRTRETLPAPPADTKALALSPGLLPNLLFLPVGQVSLPRQVCGEFSRGQFGLLPLPIGQHQFAKTYLILLFNNFDLASTSPKIDM